MRIARSLLALCLMGILGCAAAPSGWDTTNVESLKQIPVDLLKNLDSGSFAAMLDQADSNVVILDFDANNQPIRTDGIANSRAFMSEMTDLAKSQGLKFTSTISRNDAWATSTMGYGVVDYDQSIEAGGQTMGPFKFRGTYVARRDGERWLLTHWHGSFSQMPAPMASADTTGAR